MGALIGLGTLGRWLPAGAASPDPAIRTRYEASSPQGLAMLGLYRQAVGIMQDPQKTPLHDPKSWRFWADTHQYPQAEPLDTEIFHATNNVDEPAVKKHRVLALGSDVPGQIDRTVAVWATCPHADPLFLPWHRLYLAYFERTIESVVGKPFSLPYWNYLDPKKRFLPEPFREPIVDGTPNALYFAARTPQFLQEGLREDQIDALQARNVLMLLQNVQLLETARAPGFSGDIEDNLHNMIHSAIGTGEGMGSPEYAARDPIFWLHHANIDRLWESWRAAGPDGRSRRDPEAANAWWNTTWGFVDIDGERVARDVTFAVLSPGSLGFRYDALEDVKPPVASVAEQLAAPFPRSTLQESMGSQKSIRTPNDAVTFEFAPVQNQSAISAFSANAKARYELVIELNTRSAPGLYQVFIKGADKQGAVASTEKRIGSFSLFSAGARQHHHGEGAIGKADTTIRIDITNEVKSKSIDPAHPGQVTVRPNYLSEPVDVTIKSISIVAK